MLDDRLELELVPGRAAAAPGRARRPRRSWRGPTATRAAARCRPRWGT